MGRPDGGVLLVVCQDIVIVIVLVWLTFFLSFYLIVVCTIGESDIKVKQISTMSFKFQNLNMSLLLDYESEIGSVSHVIRYQVRQGGKKIKG